MKVYLGTLINGANIDTKIRSEWLPIGQSCIATYEGMPALLLAIYKNNQTLVEELLHRKANVNAGNDNNFTSLMSAARDGDVVISKKLIDYGADISAIDKNGKSVMDYAKEFAANTGSNKMITLLDTYVAQPTTKPKVTKQQTLFCLEKEMGYF